jgi:predicted PurR-regulated permease PerM
MTHRLFLLITFLVLIVLAFLLIKPFFSTIVISLISVILLKPLYNYFRGKKRLKERPRLAVSFTLISFFLIIVIPLFFLVYLTVTQLAGALEELGTMDPENIVYNITQSLENLPLFEQLQQQGVSIANGMRLLAQSIALGLTEFAISIGSSLPGLLAQGIIFIVIVASLLPHYDRLVEQSQRISPLGYEVSALYNRKITAMVKSLVMGVFLIAIIQGAVMGFFYWLAGMNFIFLLTVLSMVLAMLPMVGISWLVIAIAIIALLTGNTSQALIVLFGFYGVVNWIDIFLRPKLLAEEASLHFALFILAIFGGIAWAGVMGLFYGPIIMLLLVTTIEIYVEQFSEEDGQLLESTLRERFKNGAKVNSTGSDNATPGGEVE